MNSEKPKKIKRDYVKPGLKRIKLLPEGPEGQKFSKQSKNNTVGATLNCVCTGACAF